MTILHVKSPNGTEKAVDIDKIVTTDGATMTGHFIRNYSFARPSSDDSWIEIWGGTTRDTGAVLLLRGKDTYSGGFLLLAHDGTNEKILQGYSNGDLIWDTHHIVTMGVHGPNARGIQTGGIGVSVAANSVYDGTVTFPLAFGAVPSVLLSFHGGAKNATVSSFSANPNGFSYRILNMEPVAKDIHVTWLAIM